jgi:transcriptional regulator with XRE-family HTH domain
MQDTLARKLRVLRAERGLTLREAEQLTGVDKDTLSKIERGLRHPYDVTLSKLARGYEVPVEDLLEEPILAGKLEDGPSLEELHEETECETDWLVKSEEEWREAWEQISSPREAVMAVFDLGDEYSAVSKRIAEQDPQALPHTLFSGRYKQAFLRWMFGMQNAHSCGVAAGTIGIADTLNVLVKEVGLEDEMRRREEKRKERGAEPFALEGMQLAS